MLEKFEVGSIVDGKVTGIKPFGAFVALDDQHQGLVHISEIAHGYVKDINEQMSVGDEIKVKILSIDEETGRISLSIRATQPAPERQERPARPPRQRREDSRNTQPESTQGFNTFEDKLKDWLKQSTERQTELNKRNKR